MPQPVQRDRRAFLQKILPTAPALSALSACGGGGGGAATGSGTRILFQSDWGSADPSNPIVNPNATVDSYVLILPTYKI